MSHHEIYFEYLKKQSFLGKAYRKLFLRPLLKKYLKGKLLDVGCGIGDMLDYMPNSVGVDVNQYNVDFCKKRGLEAYLTLHDILNFCNDEFDSALLDNVLEHIESPTELLIEIKRVLKNGGVLVIGVPGIKGFSSDSDHKVFYQENDLIDLARKSGFEVNNFFYMPFFKSKFLSKKLRQYAVYSVWIKQ
jgi:SAM-dependent methyltransferase